MRRVIDMVLIAAIIGAAATGAYFLGRHIDNLSNQAASQDSELNSTTVVRPVFVHHHSDRTWYFVGGAVGIAVGAMAIGSVAESFARSRRRQRWHAT